MNAAWRLHLENVELRHQLKVATKPTRHLCVYCGVWTKRDARACQAHEDLPALDTGYHGLTEAPRTPQREEIPQ